MKKTNNATHHWNLFLNLNESKLYHLEVSFTKALFLFTTSCYNKMWLRFRFEPLSTNSEIAFSYKGTHAIDPCIKWEHTIKTERG